MRMFLFTLVAAVSLLEAAPAHAQSRGALESRVTELEAKVAEQDQIIDEMFERIDRMDRRGRRQPRAPQTPYSVNCMIVDSGFKKTYLGTGSTKIDAEYAAKAACERDAIASYCQSTPKCDSTRDNPGSRGAVCIVVDSGFKRTFRGEGTTPVAAEAAAKKACQADTIPSYCGPVAARCDLQY